MDIVTKNSEALFADLLAKIHESPASWMCAHVQMATLNDGILDAEGLSQKTLEKIHQISLKLAKQIYDLELKNFEGQIFIFEDGDILAVFSCSEVARQQMVENLGKEFESQGLGHLFSYYPLQNKMESLVSLSKTKVETANEYKLKRHAVSTVDNIFIMTEPDRDLQIALQVKRRQHVTMIVLVIEDDVVTRGLVAATLKKSYKVVQAKDAKSGIAAYIAHAPNVVFLDIHLPDYSGKVVLDRLKFIDPAAYVVMISTDSVADNVLSTHAKGSAGFIKKPFSKEKIFEYVEKCPIKGKGTLIKP